MNASLNKIYTIMKIKYTIMNKARKTRQRRRKLSERVLVAAHRWCEQPGQNWQKLAAEAQITQAKLSLWKNQTSQVPVNLHSQTLDRLEAVVGLADEYYAEPQKTKPQSRAKKGSKK